MTTQSVALDMIIKESLNLAYVTMEEVFDHLKCKKDGLSSDEVKERLNLFGYNKLQEKKKDEADYQDFVGIIVLLIINSTISFIEENNAGNAAAVLMAQLTPKAKVIIFKHCFRVLRDRKWTEEDAARLVPGDIISIKLGDIFLAAARLLEGDPLKIDQSALTGESLPVTKNPGDAVYSGSTCKQGELEGVVIATGIHTFFGKSADLVENTTHVSHFQ